MLPSSFSRRTSPTTRTPAIWLWMRTKEAKTNYCFKRIVLFTAKIALWDWGSCWHFHD